MDYVESNRSLPADKCVLYLIRVIIDYSKYSDCGKTEKGFHEYFFIDGEALHKPRAVNVKMHFLQVSALRVILF